jgi:hypothetical protein
MSVIMSFFPVPGSWSGCLSHPQAQGWAMGQKDSKPSYSHSYDYGNTSSGYTSRYAGNTSSSYNTRYTPSSENNVQPETHARLQRKYSRIGDDYRSLSQVCLGGMACIAIGDMWFPLSTSSVESCYSCFGSIILGEIWKKLLPPFHIACRFDFSRYIHFCYVSRHKYISRFVVKGMYLEKPKRQLIWNGGSILIGLFSQKDSNRSCIFAFSSLV